jgi:uncharacterized protein
MKNINKKTLVIGASPKPERYSNKAIRMLREYNHEVVALAKRIGQVDGITIQTEFPKVNDIHTITMYLGAKHQPEYYTDILSMKPQRVIFNPGAENDEFKGKLETAGIDVIENCTLVMLRTGQF